MLQENLNTASNQPFELHENNAYSQQRKTRTQILFFPICYEHCFILQLEKTYKFSCSSAGWDEDTEFVCPAGTAGVTKRIRRTPVNRIQDNGDHWWGWESYEKVSYQDYCGSCLDEKKTNTRWTTEFSEADGSLTVRRTWSRKSHVLNLDEMKKITSFEFRWDEEDFQEGRPKQTVSQQDRPQCNAFRTEVYRNEKKKRYWRKILLQKQQYFMFCVWMNMSQGLVRENAKYRETSKSVGGGPWNASRESW